MSLNCLPKLKLSCSLERLPLPVRFLGNNCSPWNQRAPGQERHHSHFKLLTLERSRIVTAIFSLSQLLLLLHFPTSAVISSVNLTFHSPSYLKTLWKFSSLHWSSCSKWGNIRQTSPEGLMVWLKKTQRAVSLSLLWAWFPHLETETEWDKNGYCSWRTDMPVTVRTIHMTSLDPHKAP